MDEKASEVRETPSPYGEQDSWGNDVAALRRNLKLTPLERLRRLEDAAKFSAEFRGALVKHKI